jgi:hypothetical protein
MGKKSKTEVEATAEISKKGSKPSVTVNTKVEHQTDRITIFSQTKTKIGQGKPEHTIEVGVKKSYQ